MTVTCGTGPRDVSFIVRPAGGGDDVIESVAGVVFRAWAKRSHTPRDRPAEGLERTRQLPSHPRRAAMRVEKRDPSSRGSPSLARGQQRTRKVLTGFSPDCPPRDRRLRLACFSKPPHASIPRKGHPSCARAEDSESANRSTRAATWQARPRNLKRMPRRHRPAACQTG